MRLNKATTHAIRILVACARSGDIWVKVAELADQLDLTQQNTFKIVHLLSRAGFVQAMRGRYGGVRLARPASLVRVGEVVRAMEEFPSESGDDKGRRTEPQSEGLALIDEAFEAFISVLNQSSIADMAAAETPPSPRRNAKGAGKPSKIAKTSSGRQPRRTSARL